jgi:threonine/homoserine/homoserine lactone efflux protein
MIAALCGIALAFGFFGSMPLAGPVSLVVVSRAAERKYGQAARVAVGAAVAEGLYAGIAFWGFTSLVARLPLVVPISHAAAALILLGLGVRFAVWKPRTATQKKKPGSGGSTLFGFSLAALNPTLLVTWGAAVAFIYSKGLGRSSALEAVPFGVSAAVGVAGWLLILVAIMRRLEGKLPRGVLTWTIRVLGIALVGLGVWSGAQFVWWARGETACDDVWQSAPSDRFEAHFRHSSIAQERGSVRLSAGNRPSGPRLAPSASEVSPCPSRQCLGGWRSGPRRASPV